MKKLFVAVLILVLVGVGAYLFLRQPAAPQTGEAPTGGEPADVSATTTATTTVTAHETVIGKSAGGREIIARHFGAAEATTTKEVLLVGGVHGGYSWNTALVAYQAMDYLEAHPEVVPANVRVTVVPVLNPDGLAKVTDATGTFNASDVTATEATRVAGRFNGHNVDLNRNFDCDWQADAVWQTKKVSGGTAAFSEPEAAALKGYVDAHPIAAALVWYSSAGGAFASNCHGGVLPETAAMLKTFAAASGYAPHQEFDFYEVTGDLTNWLAKRGTPAISVLLTSPNDTEWEKNRKGLEAVFASYGN